MIKKYKGSLGIITLLTVTLAIFPFINDSFYLMSILTLANLYAVFVVSWDIVSGYTGKLNLGHALFIGIGAYSVGILHDTLGLILSILVGVVLSILVAFIIGKQTMRLHGPFFSLTTMVLPLILFQLAYTYRNLTGGEFGLNVSVPLSRMELYYVTLAYMFISVLIIFFISRSRTGKILLAIKEDETACSAIGNNVEKYKLMAFLISAFFAGLGGGLLALYLRHVGPNVFELWQSATILIMGIVGGMGTIIGPFLSAYGLTFLSEWLRGTEEYQDLIYAGLLILSILILPNGLASVGAFVKRKFKERGKGTDDNVSGREINESLRKGESG